MRRARQILSGMVVLLLFLPASDTLPTTRWNIHLVQRLRSPKRESPDTGLDKTFRSLLPFLPANGDIGFQSVDPSDDGRLFVRAQYALVPRQLLRSTTAEFVVETGPADAAGSLTRDARFRVITAPDDSLRLLRRVQQ